MTFKLFPITAAGRPSLHQSESTQTVYDGEKLIRMLIDAGITRVVNLSPFHDGRIAGRIVCDHRPLPGGPLRPDLIKEIEYAATRVASTVLAGGTVLTSCLVGKNRSGLVNGLALMRIDGISGEEAYERVRAAREGSLFNQDFASYLRNHEPYPLTGE